MATLDLDLDLDAPIDVVWRALADPNELATWFWPERLAAEVTFVPVPGAAWRIESPVAGMAVGGTVTEAAAPVRLVFTWAWDGEERANPSTVFVTVNEFSPGRSSIHLAHEGLADGEELADHEQGWRDCLARLVAHVSPGADG